MIKFESFTLICHMENENITQLMSNISSMPEKLIRIDEGSGNTGTEVLDLSTWKKKCISYFNRHYKAENVITISSEKNKVVETLTQVCSTNKGHGFVFENYDMITHLDFLGYDKPYVNKNLASNLQDKATSYLAYIEQRGLLLVCETMSHGFDTNDSINRVVNSIKCFLAIHINAIRTSNVTIVGLLIREHEQEQEGKSYDCKFCNLFIAPYAAFQSLSNFDEWLESIGNHGNWKDSNPSENGSELFINLAAEILCFMAHMGKEIPKPTKEERKQFEQTYLLYTPQKINALLTDRKHIIIQGSYGSGKSILGLRKLEQIARNSPQDIVIYLNFDSRSKLHFQMKQNVEARIKDLHTKIELTNSITEILESPDASIYVCHNNAGENLSTILFKIAQVKEIIFHIVIEEYDGETLTKDEADKIINVINSNYFHRSNILVLTQVLKKQRQWIAGKKSFKTETYMFDELESLFNIIKLEEVQRCSSKIFKLISSTQRLVDEECSVFQIKKEKKKPKKLHVNKFLKSRGKFQEGGDSNNEDEMNFKKMSLDQAFECFTAVQSKRKGKNKILTTFSFNSKPRQLCEID